MMQLNYEIVQYDLCARTDRDLNKKYFMAHAQRFLLQVRSRVEHIHSLCIVRKVVSVGSARRRALFYYTIVCSQSC